MLSNIVKIESRRRNCSGNKCNDERPTLSQVCREIWFGGCRQHSTDMKTDREYVVQDSSPTFYSFFNLCQQKMSMLCA